MSHENNHSVELQMLIDERRVEVIDVQPRKDFEKMHVLVARSIPLKSFRPHSVLAHRRFKKAPIYIIGGRKSSGLARCRRPCRGWVRGANCC